MTVAKYVQPNFTDPSQTAATYKANIDGGMSVLHAVAGDFAPHALDTPAMQITVDAGKIINADGTLTNVAAQNTGTITKPTLNPRIDRVVLNPATGAIAVIAGAEAVTPTAPAITAGYLPICQIVLTTSTTAITNSMITDERTYVEYDDRIGGARFDETGKMTAGSVPTSLIPFRGAFVYTLSQSIPDFVSTKLNFGSEVYDTDSFHDNATNNTRITVPSGVSYVRIVGNVSFAANATGHRAATIYKNGAGLTPILGASVQTVNSATYGTGINAVSPVLAVSAGDYFELAVAQTSGGPLIASGHLALEVVG